MKNLSTCLYTVIQGTTIMKKYRLCDVLICELSRGIRTFVCLLFSSKKTWANFPIRQNYLLLDFLPDPRLSNLAFVKEIF